MRILSGAIVILAAATVFAGTLIYSGLVKAAEIQVRRLCPRPSDRRDQQQPQPPNLAVPVGVKSLRDSTKASEKALEEGRFRGENQGARS